MKILIVHTHYLEPGGEDQVFDAEAQLLQARGHQVVRFTRHNKELLAMGTISRARATVWNRTMARQLRGLIRREQPKIVHFHNTFPLMSPTVLRAAKAEGALVVQTLHNFRLICANALFFRDGSVCEDCMGKGLPWPGILHACYRQSRAASAATAAMLAIHRAAGTWDQAVDMFLTPSHFAREKFIAGGISPDRIRVKPNFVDPDPGTGNGKGGYALFVGRLSPEKGIGVLLAAWDRLDRKIPLKIVGDGPLGSRVAAASQRISQVEWLGQMPPDQVLDLMGDAAFLVVPSQWYETFGRVIAEAFAKGTPVIGSNIGAMAELIEPERSGLVFRPGDAGDLATKVDWMLAHPEALSRMRPAARAEFEQNYGAERNYERLMEIYELVISQLG